MHYKETKGNQRDASYSLGRFDTQLLEMVHLVSWYLKKTHVGWIQRVSLGSAIPSSLVCSLHHPFWALVSPNVQ